MLGSPPQNRISDLKYQRSFIFMVSMDVPDRLMGKPGKACHTTGKSGKIIFRTIRCSGLALFTGENLA